MATVTAPATTGEPQLRAPKSTTKTKGRRKLPKWAGAIIGIVGVLVIWQILGAIDIAKGGIPTATKVFSHMGEDGWSFYWENIKSTMTEAITGYLWGNALAIGLAFIVLIIPLLEKPALQLGIVSYCVPVIAIGPILHIVFANQTKTPPMILAALFVFFTTLVGTLVGLRSAEPVMFDLVHAYGGGRVKELTKIRLKAALPSVFAALRIAGPAAILGAILGEYMGADNGIGIAMINSQAQFDVPRTWGLALVSGFLAIMAYALTAGIGRLATPWAPRST
jgi:ABC-type nitrate/sulfonate/bicarbonate transport system permease component